MIKKQIKSISKLSLGLLFSSFILLSTPSISFAEGDLQSGPMLGYSEMREVLLWVQTTKEAKVKFVYWDKKDPSKKYSTKEIQTEEKNAFTAKLIADQVEPSKKYEYELYINSKKVSRPYTLEFQTQALWKWRTEPPEFKVAVGSCTYVNEPEFDRPGRNYGEPTGKIFNSIYNKKPDLMLWTGDNTYLREPDWNSRTGILKRYTHTRSFEPFQALLANTHNYAVWDDHDYGPNDSDATFRNKEDALEAFKLFWGNPTYGLSNVPSVFTRFEWADVEFFLVDDRMYRTPEGRKHTNRTMLGQQQFDWLIDSLASSQATFKIVVVGGQVLNPADSEFIETYVKFPEEKEKLLTALEKENIKGVVFLTGDRHQSELSILKREKSYPLYDFTVSPLTAGPYDSSKENNYLRVPGTLYADHNFGTMTFSGPKKDRKMTFSLFDKDGKELWNREIKASELK